MALATDYPVWGLTDAKIYPLTGDVVAATGGPGYSTGIDVYGVTNVTLAPIVTAKELLGDGKTMASSARTTGVDIEVSCGYMQLAVIPYILGGATTASGTTPNQVQTYRLSDSNNEPSYIKVEGIWDSGEPGIGNAKLVVHKMKVTEAPTISVNDANGDYGTVTFKGRAVYTASYPPLYGAATTAGACIDLLTNETAATCSA